MAKQRSLKQILVSLCFCVCAVPVLRSESRFCFSAFVWARAFMQAWFVFVCASSYVSISLFTVTRVCVGTLYFWPVPDDTTLIYNNLASNLSLLGVTQDPSLSQYNALFSAQPNVYNLTCFNPTYVPDVLPPYSPNVPVRLENKTACVACGRVRACICCVCLCV